MKKLQKKNPQNNALVWVLSYCYCQCGCNGICNCDPIPTHQIQSGVTSQGKDTSSTSNNGSIASTYSPR